MLTIARYGTNDLARAGRFYDVIARIVGARRVHEGSSFICYQGAAGVMFTIGVPFEGTATVGNGVQLGFATSQRPAVDAVYAAAIEAGAADEGAPGPRGAAASGFYAAYFRDLDGNKVMVYHRSA